MKEIIPKYELPTWIGRDKGGSYIQQVVQDPSKSLGIDWNLHWAWRPRSSGKCESVNRTIKTHLAKLCQETHLKWINLLLFALFCIRCTPRGKLGLSLYEMVFRRAPSLIQPKPENVTAIGRLQLREQVQALRKIIQDLQKHVQSQRPMSIAPVHPFQPGDWVWLKDWKRGALQPKWRGPHVILLTTPTAMKLKGVKLWVHYSRLKRAHAQWSVTPNPQNPL